MSGKHVAIYVRVSSTTQKADSQRQELNAWLSSANQKLPVKWYQDVGTGTNMNRPEMDKLMQAVYNGQISSVVCWRLDRLGRTAKGLVGLFDELQIRKVNLISVKDSLDLSTPAGRLMCNVLASVAAFETEVRKERQLAGIAAAKAKGKKWGGSAKGRHYKVTDDHCEVVKRMYEDGKKIAAIARITKLSRPTIYKLLGAGK